MISLVFKRVAREGGREPGSTNSMSDACMVHVALTCGDWRTSVPFGAQGGSPVEPPGSLFPPPLSLLASMLEIFALASMPASVARVSFVSRASAPSLKRAAAAPVSREGAGQFSPHAPPGDLALGPPGCAQPASTKKRARACAPPPAVVGSPLGILPLGSSASMHNLASI